MKETTSMTMPSCFRRWCDRFNDVFKTKTQKTRFRDYQDLGKISHKYTICRGERSLTPYYIYWFCVNPDFEEHESFYSRESKEETELV
ncbi:MAG: hypothetical protein O4805_17245 [Trichodesmium sp. St16_bin2-tuft]|nr:hypothetical protein [Trichodesmium sp. MAG_R02]MDE5088777.1 hypothetical protein [Trichodesmium sp. St16_bin2-tuft]